MGQSHNFHPEDFEIRQRLVQRNVAKLQMMMIQVVCHRAEEMAKHQIFHVDDKTGEVRTPHLQLCMTAGWPMLTSVAFITPDDKRVFVVMNEADDTASIALFDEERDSKPLGFSIDAKSMQH